METEQFLEWISDAWKWVKGFAKYTIESNFTCREDFAFFILLFSLAVFLIAISYAIGYDVGHVAGDAEGAKRGWAGATTYLAP